MNRTPARPSAATMDLPSRRESSRLSSAIIEMPSKPRKDRTAIETAPKTSDQENVEESNSGLSAPAWALPWARTTTPTTMKIASTMSSPISMIFVMRAVIWMPV